jgi:hypothetical protein
VNAVDLEMNETLELERITDEVKNWVTINDCRKKFNHFIQKALYFLTL